MRESRAGEREGGEDDWGWAMHGVVAYVDSEEIGRGQATAIC